MSVIEGTMWLAGHALRGLLDLWPVTLGVFSLTVMAMLLQDQQNGDQRMSLASMLWLFPALSLVWGGFVRHDDPAAALDLDATIVLGMLVVLQAGATAAVIYVAKGRRLVTSLLGVLVGWVAGMCVYAVVTA